MIISLYALLFISSLMSDSMLESETTESALCEKGALVVESIKNTIGDWKADLTLNSWKRTEQKFKTQWAKIMTEHPASTSFSLLDLDTGHTSAVEKPFNNRIFITAPLYPHHIIISVHKYASESEMEIVVCLMDHAGKIEEIKTHQAVNVKTNGTKFYKLQNVNGKVLIISIQNTSSTIDLQYRIRAD
jgi:hypothetical protein